MKLFADSDVVRKPIPFAGILLQVTLLGIMSFSGTIKYIFCFGVIVLGLALGFTKMRIDVRKSSHKQAIRVVLPFVSAALLGLLFDVVNDQTLINEGLRQAIMYLEPPTLAAVVLHYAKDDEQVVGLQFFSTVLIFLATTVTSFSVENLMESTAAFSFGLFALHYLLKRKWGMLFVAVVCLVLANKRIATGAVFLAGFLFLLLRFRKNMKMLLTISYCVFSVFVLLYLYSLYSGHANRIFAQLHINTMGRQDLYFFFSSEFDAITSFNTFAYGLGYVIVKLQQINYSAYAGNLHNDWLSLLLECGIPMLLLFITLTLAVIRRCRYESATQRETSALIFALLLYWQILWLTDNVSIYVFCLYPYYTIVFSLFRKQESVETTNIGSRIEAAPHGRC